ncbi:DNA-directed RNA polymerase subunit K [Candidatus Pacearchaeota archaeon]|nr:DNA-directed RNA polymerase subunit K [Candidatus Pacearchaeota archaeon]
MKLADFTEYEKARILGARALQIAMNAPILIKIEKDNLEKIKYDALKIAEIELNSEILPISIKRPFPQKNQEELKRVKEKINEKEIQERKNAEEEEIAQGGEIMELANPEDEREENLDETREAQ